MAFTPKKRKALEAAQKYAQKGAYDKALKEYLKLLKADPQDPNIRLKIGDLYLKKGDKQAAIESYGQVAEQFSKGGFDAKAVAIYKQILRVDEDFLEARVKLGEHFQRMGLNSDALREFQEGVRLCQERELKREALDLLKKVASLDPSNVSNRLNLADLFLREKLVDEARAEFDSLLEEVQRQTANDLLARVAEHAVDAFPDHYHALELLAQAKVSLGEAEDAIRLLNDAQHRFPDEQGILEALVMAYNAAGDEVGKQRAYREIAEMFKRRGDNDKARDILQRFVVAESFTAGDDTYTSPSILLTEETMGELSLDLGEESEFGKSEPGKSEEADFSAGEELTPRTPGSQSAPVMLDVPDLDHSPGLDLSSADDLIAEAKVALEFGDPATAARLAKQAAETNPTSVELGILLAQLEKPNDPGVEDLAAQLEEVGVSMTPRPVPAARGPKTGASPNRTTAKPPAPATQGKATAPSLRTSQPPSKSKRQPTSPATANPRVKARPEPGQAKARPEPKQAKARPEPRPEPPGMDSLPNVEIVLADGGDDDSTYASVDPPDELMLGLSQPSKVIETPQADVKPDAEPELEVDLDIDVEIDVDIDVELEGESLDIDAALDEVTPSDGGPGESAMFGSSTDSFKEQPDLADMIGKADSDFEANRLDEAEQAYRAILEIVPNHPQAQVRLGEIEARKAGNETLVVDGESAATPPANSKPAARSEAKPASDSVDVGPATATPASIPEIHFTQEPRIAAEDTMPPIERELEEAAVVEDTGAPGQPGSELELAVEMESDEASFAEMLGKGSPADAVLEPELEAEPEPIPEPEPVPISKPAPAPVAAAAPVASSEPEVDLQAVLESTLEPVDADPIIVVDSAEPMLADAPAAAVPVPARDDANEEDLFDFAKELEAELEAPAGASGQEQIGFDEVFRAFKKGIQEQVGEEEVGAHYDLAIAYKEMGLLEDSIRELEIVRRSGTMGINALSLMAHCKLELGRFGEAETDLQTALTMVASGDEIGTSLRYDLGEVLLAANKREQALAAFQAVASADPTFRDVTARISELQ
ncbi:MAG: tetratricopeptide repeat protein [bacterium]|nr:tetratricopeptide repeat protein [bacterium]